MKNDVYFADTISGIALCYPFSPTSNKLIAVNLTPVKSFGTRNWTEPWAGTMFISTMILWF
jgi:hypothetical protein